MGRGETVGAMPPRDDSAVVWSCLAKCLAAGSFVGRAELSLRVAGLCGALPALCESESRNPKTLNGSKPYKP